MAVLLLSEREDAAMETGNDSSRASIKQSFPPPSLPPGRYRVASLIVNHLPCRRTENNAGMIFPAICSSSCALLFLLPPPFSPLLFLFHLLHLLSLIVRLLPPPLPLSLAPQKHEQ
jgi:hypothetical protein